MEPSKYQQAILDWVTNGTGNAVVQAVAGSGKTTLLGMCARAIKGQVKVVAFGRDAAAQLKAKMPYNADCATCHSVGSRAWSKTTGRRYDSVNKTLDSDKTYRIYAKMQDEKKAPKWLPKGKIKKLVGFAKAEGLVPDGLLEGSPAMTGLIPDTDEEWCRIMEHYGVEVDERTPAGLLIGVARDVLRVSIRYAAQIVDFDDMLYMPTLTDGVAFERHAWVFVDELQDISGLQREMILRMVAAGGRFLGVGDRAQAIYGFRGADAASMGKVIAATGAVELPLSVCYRCPTLVLDEARKIVPQIEAAETAEPGVVEHRDEWKPAEIQPGHLVICRNRAPMITLAYRLLAVGTRVRMLGRGESELLDYVERLAKKTRVTEIEDFLISLEIDTDKQVAKVRKLKDEVAEDSIRDRDATIRAIAEGSEAQNVTELCDRIRDLFSDGTDGIPRVLCGTVHAVKGLEAEEVWFLDSHLIGCVRNRQPWVMQQEQNLLYVGITRARKALRFIDSEGGV